MERKSNNMDSVTWTAHHSVNTPPPAVFLHAVPSRAEVSRAEPSRAEPKLIERSMTKKGNK
jgi:hypothetical protein